MSVLTKGQAIKWTATDEQGQFSYTGVVTDVDKERVVFVTSMGTMSVPVGDGSLTPTKMSKKVKELTLPDVKVKKAEKSSAEPKKTRAKRSRNGGPTKFEQALVIYNDLAGKGHGKDVTIQRFMDVLGMTVAGATTYFYNCKKVAK